MSFILQALRKSEAERADHHGGGTPSVIGVGALPDDPQRPRRRRAVWPWVLSGIVVLAVALAWWAVDRSGSVDQPMPPSAESGAVEGGVETPPSAAIAIPEAPLPAVVLPLLTQAPPPTRAKNTAEEGAAAVNTAAASIPAGSLTAVPERHELPSALRATLPELRLDVHNYSADPKRRFVLINMRRARVGDTVAGGLTVLDIVARGVIVRWRGQPFLLRPGD